jgi:methionyl-tRNA formyltransferase
MKTPIRVVFLGSDSIALPLLNWLVTEASSSMEIVAVFTQPDRAVGRGQKVTANSIKNWALLHGLPVLQPEKLTDDARTQLAALQPDLALVMAYGHILRDEFINAPRLGTINLHASILPRYRGASPIQTAIANGEKETGISLMRIVRRLDAGPVADIERVPIGPLDTAVEVETKLSSACVPLLQRNLRSLVEDTLTFRPQDDSAATFCRRLDKEDSSLDFVAAADVLAARVNGLFPWPACAAQLSGQFIKFGLADVAETSSVSDSAHQAGVVVGSDNEGLLISTGRGVLRIRRMQRSGGRMLDAQEFLRGFSVSIGTRVESRPMSALVGPVPFKKV